MVEPLNETRCERYCRRLQALEPHVQPRFGTLSAHGMLAHLHRTFIISLGEHEAPFIGNRLTRSRLMKWFVIDAPFPWPRGRIKAPADFTPPPHGDFECNRLALFQVMRRFAEQADARPEVTAGQSPILGPLPYRRWARLHARHLEHHFQQFGV